MIHVRAARCDLCLTTNNPGVSTEQALEVLANHFASTGELSSDQTVTEETP